MSNFISVAKVSDFDDQQAKCIEVAGKSIALFKLDDEFFAIDDTCTHKGGPLSEGNIEGDEVECPWHGAHFNINPSGASHRAHSHPNNYLSRIYYVQTQARADTINFHDPRAQTGIIRPPVTELTVDNTDQVVVKVDSGTLLVFPSYLQHSVESNNSDGERISISFNIMFSSFTENLCKPLW